MSVIKLKLSDDRCDFEFRVYDDKRFVISICTLDGYELMYLDRNQAHLLMLYLQEHLK